MNNLIGLVKGEAVLLEQDPWQLVLEDDQGEHGAFRILRLPAWMAAKESGAVHRHPTGVLLGPDDNPALLAPWIEALPIIVLQFPSFRDGRAYSQANLLRTRYRFDGELRAVGDVLRDQLVLMRHCGFSSFAVREDKSVQDALKGLSGFDLIYARSVTHPEPLFRRRTRSAT